MSEKATNRLKILRQKHGLSQQQLADLAGMKQSQVFRVENNQAGLTIENALKICEILNEPLENLWDQTYKNKPAKKYDFLGSLHDWQLEDLKDAIVKELKRREKEGDYM